MKIHGIEGMTHGDLRRELELGGRFVFYKYVISALVITFRRPSEIYFVRAGESRVAKGLGYTALTFFLGWWGIPWGPIFSIGSLYANLSGGEDVTGKVRDALGLGSMSSVSTQPSQPPPLPGQS